MTVNLTEYVNKRIEELKSFKSETFGLLKDMEITFDKLSEEEERELLENKMKYYSASGALMELEQLKKVLNG
ncbi:hypothetical protein RCG24_14590 [Neobacillus sp. OS1-32]|jgi:hypothetical protein|uniref:hypothetical protein n=1 Tax=Neobacillus sp. OS1-32 TaxID=3070682 RepID=UPI0027E06386|nr:hypothetical protein [Neobacillus sp. OS1-32]WML29214.1 hypothetical protein RCG24_14590 [Neobacillus sp. OS1-32]